MKILKKITSVLLDHGVSSMLGWFAGLIVVQLINSAVEEEGLTNLWGYWSDKTVVDHSTYTAISWIVTALVGWGISELWQKLSSQALKSIRVNKNIEV